MEAGISDHVWSAEEIASLSQYREIAARYAMFVDEKAKQRQGDSEDYLRARSFLDLLDYIAHLI